MRPENPRPESTSNGRDRARPELGFLIRGPFNAAQHIARQPTSVPCPLAPWAGSSDILGPFNILKGFRDQICLNPSGMLCFPTFLYTKVSDSPQTPVLRGHYCVKSAMFFRTNLSDSLRHPGCECTTTQKVLCFYKCNSPIGPFVDAAKPQDCEAARLRELI